jgi:hypothetical protein
MGFDAHANMSRRGLYHRQFHHLRLARRNRLNRSVCHTHLRFVSRLKRQSKSRTPLSWGLNSRRWWGDLLACRRRRALPIVWRRHISCCLEISVRPAIHPEKPRESNCRDQSSDSYVRRCRASKVCGKWLSLRSPLPSKKARAWIAKRGMRNSLQSTPARSDLIWIRVGSEYAREPRLRFVQRA